MMGTSDSFFYFVVSPFGGRIQNSKKIIFVFDSNLGADWWEDIENQKKNTFLVFDVFPSIGTQIKVKNENVFFLNFEFSHQTDEQQNKRSCR